MTNWLKEGKLAAPIMEAFEDGLCEIYNEPQALGHDSASVHSQMVDANSAKTSPDQPTTYASLAQAVREVKIRQLPNYLYEDLLMMFEAMQEHLMEQDKRITREAASLLKATREANTLRDPRPPAAEEWLVMMEALQQYLLERDEGIARELKLLSAARISLVRPSPACSAPAFSHPRPYGNSNSPQSKTA